MSNQQLLRTWYKTDVTPDDPDGYVGVFSIPFPAESGLKRIVDVDWSKQGEVQVTWLVGVT